VWGFWRAGKLTKRAIHQALSVAYGLGLFDARWMLGTIQARGGSLKGTDALADGLTKDDLAQWIRRVHETGDGTPTGLVAALGWDKIVAKTTNEALLSVLDATAAEVGLVARASTGSSSAPLPDPDTGQSYELVVEDDAESDTPPTAPRIVAAPRIEVAPIDDEQTQVRRLPRRSERPPVQEPGLRR
jgi:hypothetical protein